MNMQLTAQNVSMERKSFFPALIALTLGAFAIGMAELVIMGLLPSISLDLHIPISKAGLLISGYAIGVAIGGPVLSALTIRMPRKRMLYTLMIIFILGNLIASMSSSYELLMIARIISSLAHGTFMGLAALVAASMAGPEKRASAIASITAGMTIATIAGVPLGTLIGQHFGWEATFIIIGLFGIMSLLGIIRFVPEISFSQSGGVRSEIHAFARPDVLIALGVIVFGFGGLFTAFTYIAPILTDLAGFQEHNITLVLILFGIGVTLGNIYGGKVADWRLVPSLLVNLFLLTIVMFVFHFTVVHKISALITIFIWGFFAYSIVPAIQVRVLDAAKDAPTLASTMIHTAFNIGNAGGAALGGFTVTFIGLQYLPWIAAGVTFTGLVLMLSGLVVERKKIGARLLLRRSTKPELTVKERW